MQFPRFAYPWSCKKRPAARHGHGPGPFFSDTPSGRKPTMYLVGFSFLDPCLADAQMNRIGIPQRIVTSISFQLVDGNVNSP